MHLRLKMPTKTKKNPPTKQKKLFNDDIFKANYKEVPQTLWIIFRMVS